MDHEGAALPDAKGWQLTGARRQSIELRRQALRTVAQRAAACHRSARFPDFREALDARLLVVQEEARDAVQLAKAEFARAESAVTAARHGGNQGQITRTQNIGNTAAAVVDMTSATWGQRERWLTRCGRGLNRQRDRGRRFRSARPRSARLPSPETKPSSRVTPCAKPNPASCLPLCYARG